MKRFALAMAVLVTAASPALAIDYYVAKGPGGRCMISEGIPPSKLQVTLVGGTKPYATRAEAEAAMKKIPECK